MSDANSALPGATYSGSVEVREAGLRGMITLRGDLGSAKLKTAVKKLTGLDVPEQGAIALAGETGVAWMSPDELLLLTAYSDAPDLAAQLSTALSGHHHLVANVSDARAVFALSGAKSREVLAKLTPADLSPAAFGPGQIRRTRLAQVPAAFWLSGDNNFHVVCFRSVADYVFALLKNAAHPQADVNFF
jgi:sarcosine oxidase, subunit gamma